MRVYNIFYYTWALTGLGIALYDLRFYVIYLAGSVAMALVILSYAEDSNEG